MIVLISIYYYYDSLQHESFESSIDRNIILISNTNYTYNICIVLTPDLQLFVASTSSLRSLETFIILYSRVKIRATKIFSDFSHAQIISLKLLSQRGGGCWFIVVLGFHGTFDLYYFSELGNMADII